MDNPRMPLRQKPGFWFLLTLAIMSVVKHSGLWGWFLGLRS